jgi:hypothetical protein
VQTLAAVALGELVRLMVGLWQDGQPLGVFAAAELYLQNLDILGSDLAFALLAGVVGAAGGIGWAHQRAETMRGGPAAAGTTPGVVRDGAAAPLSATPSPSGEPSSPKQWARRGTQFLVVGAVLGGLYLAVAEDGVEGDEGNVTAEPAGVPVFELQVGDCLDEPAGSEFEFVDVLPCDQRHDMEIFHRFDIPLDQATDLPSEDVLVEHIDGCLPPFERFVGVPFETSELDVMGFWPAADSWAEGNREMLCGIVTMDGTKLEGTVRDSRR